MLRYWTELNKFGNFNPFFDVWPIVRMVIFVYIRIRHCPNGHFCLHKDYLVVRSKYTGI